MITDIFTILWKELKELLFQRGNLRGGWMGLIIFFVVFGIFLPIQSGPDWVSTPLNLLYWAWVPFILVSGVIADSFAGERERHTLETLLASRLSDRAILFGKAAAGIVYGWGFTLACVLLGMITVNVAFGHGRLLLYPAYIFFGILALSLLVAALATGLGIQVSLRAATVRQAQQTFSVVYFLFFVPLFLIPLLPEAWKVRIAAFLSTASVTTIALTAAIILLLLDLFLLAAAMDRFQRSKLILD